MKFSDFPLAPAILKAVEETGYTTPSPIQQDAIPAILQGGDVVGCAQTGTGKTAAFALPILHLLSQQQGEPKGIRCLILTPTRELAIQIGQNFMEYGKYLKIRHTVIFGGVNQFAQERALKRGVDVLIATPGRLLDLMQQGFVRLHNVQILTLDEADRMLDMGFIHDIKKVIARLPVQRQNLFFSATMPREIVQLSKSILRDPTHIEVTPVSSTAEKVEQRLYYVDTRNKVSLLVHVINQEKMDSVLVFTRTKHGANKVVKLLAQADIVAEAIHGNKSQNARQKALDNFKKRRTRVLVATDIASRGIDIDELAHVINFEIPNIPETYVHRIGRTGRAGASGLAISFCDWSEMPFVRDIHKLIQKEIPTVNDHPYQMGVEPPASAVKMHAGAPRQGGERRPGGEARPHGSAKKRRKPPSRPRSDAPAQSRPQHRSSSRGYGASRAGQHNNTSGRGGRRGR